jgi:hypothetical protein
MRGSEREHSKSQFSQQPLTSFESSFVFPDRLDMSKRLQWPEIFSSVNCTLLFWTRLSSPLTLTCWHHGNFQISQQLLALFDLCFVILARNTLIERSYCLRIFGCPVQVQQIWIRNSRRIVQSWKFWKQSIHFSWKFHFHNAVFHYALMQVNEDRCRSITYPQASFSGPAASKLTTFLLNRKGYFSLRPMGHGPTRHQTASAHDLLTFRRLPDSIRKPSGKGAQRLALPPDHLGAHVCFSI